MSEQANEQAQRSTVERNGAQRSALVKEAEQSKQTGERLERMDERVASYSCQGFFLLIWPTVESRTFNNSYMPVFPFGKN